MFSILRSKKTSESGVWVPDSEVNECACCNVTFNLIIRKHHCRGCGQVVCSACSENRVYLASSRSGAPKRVCDTCYTRDHGGAPKQRGGTGDASGAGGDEEDLGRRVSKVAVSSPDDEPEEEDPKAGAAAAAAEASIAALKEFPFEGKWMALMSFHVVEMGPKTQVDVAALQDSFKRPTSVAPGKKGAADKGGFVKVGSNVHIKLKLETQGAAYFKGSCPEFGQFGKEGKVTGAVQRTTGKVNMTLQIMHPHTKITTSFNFVGLMNAKGQFVGSFSGCEISKSAGVVSGSFKMARVGDAADPDTDEEGSEEGSGSEDDRPKKKAAPKKSGSSRKLAPPSDTETESGSETDDSDAAARKKKAAAKKKRAASTDTETESDSDDAPRKKKPAASKSKRRLDASDSD